jgi:DNA-binding CsgD family transcriptional regulator
VRAWPFVGRDEELRSIVATHRAPSGCGIVIVGDAGVGKTRLAREALARLAAAGRRTEWVTATRSAAAIPFGAISHLLPLDCPDDSGLGAFLHAARHFTANGQRIVLAVDDAHLLDDPSAALVHHLALRRLACVLVTVRSGADMPDAVTALWRENLAVRLDLGPLGVRALDEIVDHALDGVLDVVSRRELHRICAGNPLLLRELLQAGTETDVLREQAGLWRWTGGMPVTTRLTEVVAARLDTVSDGVSDALEVTACGEPLPLGLLDRLVGPEVTVAAERTGLVVSEQSGRRVFNRLAHPLYAEIIRSRLTPARVRHIWGRVAAAMADIPMRRRDDHLFAGLAHLRAQRRTDPDLLLTAARRAYARVDLDLAEALARAAQEAGGGWQADQLLAEALDRNGRYTEAARVLPQPPAGDDVEHVRWAVTRARVLYWGFGQAGAAERILLDAAGRPGRGAADATRSWILLFDGRCRDAVNVSGAVLGRDAAAPDSVVPAAAAATMAATMLGRFDDAQTMYERGMDAARPLPDEPWGSTLLGIAGCLRHLFSGSAPDAWLLADDRFQAIVRRSTADNTAGTVAGIWALYRGIVARFHGNMDLAAAVLREAAVLLADSDPYHQLRLCYAELAAVAALSGDAADATGWLDRADDRRASPGRLFEPWAELNRAWVQAATGRPEAAKQARYAAALARDSEQPTLEMVALYDAARLGDADSVRHRLTKLSTVVEGPVGSAIAEAANALADGDGDALDHATTAFASFGYRLHAAETATAAARAHRQVGAQRRATRSQEQAATLIDACPKARTPLLNLADPLAGLTHREREIIRLAAAGRSGQEIAQTLHLSVRTVNNHLGRAYAKLGIPGRRALSPLLSSLGPPTPPATHTG